MSLYSDDRIESSTETDIIALLADGKFSRVYLCKSRIANTVSDSTYSVAKVYPRETAVTRSHRIMAEKTTLQRIALSNSPYIMKLINTAKDDKYLYIITEAYHCGHLNLHIQNSSSSKFSPNIARNYSAEIISALFSLSKCGCIHRDIKPKNILIDFKGHVKLCDFGASKLLFLSEHNDAIYGQNLQNHQNHQNEYPKTRTIIGTAQYMAPEIIAKCGYSIHVDWWALGVALFEMLCGVIPVFWGVPVWGNVIAAASGGTWPDEECSAIALTATQRTRTRNVIATAASYSLFVDTTSDATEGMNEDHDDFMECYDPWSVALTESNIASLRASHLSRSGWNLILQLLSPSPLDRPGPWTQSRIKEHPFFSTIKWDDIDAGVSPPPDLEYNKALGFLDLVENSHELVSEEAITADNNPFEGF